MGRFLIVKPMAALALLGLVIANVGEARGQGEPTAAELAASVEATANALGDRLANLSAAMEDSSGILERAPEILDNMLASVREAHDAMAEDSEIWTQLNDLIGEWNDHQKRVSDRARDTGNEALADLARQWQVRINETGVLRESISTERARTTSLITQLESQREIVEELIIFGSTDAVLTEMRGMQEQLAALNGELQTMVDQVRRIEGGDLEG